MVCEPEPVHLYYICVFHRLTRSAYLYNGCLALYNVVLTSRVHSSVKYSQSSTVTAAVSCDGGISVLNHCLLGQSLLTLTYATPASGLTYTYYYKVSRTRSVCGHSSGQFAQGSEWFISDQRMDVK